MLRIHGLFCLRGMNGDLNEIEIINNIDIDASCKRYIC
jgi:hypothetical protein